MQDLVEITQSDGDGTVTIAVSGALDMGNEDPFKEAILSAADSNKAVVIDLRAVSYIDTAILADLAVAAKRMRARGARLKVLVTDKSHPQYTLKTVGFGALMDITIFAAGEV